LHVFLISDIWTSKSISDYLALAARIVKDSFESESLIIGITKMSGSHCVENIKKAIETIINELNFNKAKIGGLVTDEGLIRLLKQIELSDFNALRSEK
jgi:copper chaperone CopZ